MQTQRPVLNIFLLYVVFGVKSLFGWQVTGLQDSPYPPLKDDSFLQAKTPTYRLAYDFYKDDEKKRAVRDAAGDDPLEQFKFVLNKEAALLQIKEAAVITEMASDLNANFTTADDLQNLFGFKPLGTQTFSAISVGGCKDQGSVTERLNDLKLVAVNSQNQVFFWTGANWTLISDVDDHVHAADVAFVPVGFDAGKRASDGDKALAFFQGGVPAVERLNSNRDSYTLNHEATSFFRIEEQRRFPKKAAVNEAGQVWLIGADQAVYWGGHGERYKHFSSKNDFSFFLSPQERCLNVALGDDELALETPGGIFVNSSLSAATGWSSAITASNNILAKSSRAGDLPSPIAFLTYGKGKGNLFAVLQNGLVYKLSGTLNKDNQKSWVRLPVPLSVPVQKIAIKGTNNQMLLASDGTVFSLLDSTKSLWKQLRKFQEATEQQEALKASNLVVRDLGLSGDGSACFLAGDSSGDGRLFFASKEQLQDLGSPFIGLHNGDSVLISVGNGKFLGTNAAGQLLVQTTTLIQARNNPRNVFGLYKSGDIVGLKASNGKWLAFPETKKDDLNIVTANGNNNVMDPTMSSVNVQSAASDNMQLIGSVVPVAGQGNLFTIDLSVRSTGGKLNALGNLVSTIDPETDEPFTESSFKYWFYPIQDSSALPVYLQIAESQENTSVRIGMYMQLFKDYVLPDVYESEFFTNLDETGLDPANTDLTLENILSQKWQGAIPTFVDEDSAGAVIRSLKALIEKMRQTNSSWREKDANNLRNFIGYMSNLFANVPSLVGSLDAVLDGFMSINVIRFVNLRQYVDYFAQGLNALRNNPDDAAAKKLTDFLKEVVANRILGEKLIGTGFANLANVVVWLLQQRITLAASNNVILKDFAKVLETTALTLTLPISIKERLDGITRFSRLPTLSNEEKNECLRQVNKILESNFLQRLTPGMARDFINVIQQVKAAHGLKVETAALETPINLQLAARSLRNRLNSHVDKNGWWDSAKDGATELANGLKMSIAAYTPYEFCEDLENLVNLVTENTVLLVEGKLTSELRYPLILCVRQFLESFSKGKLSQEANYTSLITRVTALAQKLQN